MTNSRIFPVASIKIWPAGLRIVSSCKPFPKWTHSPSLGSIGWYRKNRSYLFVLYGASSSFCERLFFPPTSLKTQKQEAHPTLFTGYDVLPFSFLRYSRLWTFWVQNQEVFPLTSGFPQQPQRRKRWRRPWGCCPCPGSPSFPRQIRLSAALCLRCGDFWNRNPDLSQNKKHITWKQYVVLSFLGSILSHQLFTKQDVLT